MALENQRTGQIGVNAVERIVLADWQSRWQPMDAFNDDGVDGLIFIEEGGKPTGQIVYVQVKCTKAKPNQSGRIAVSKDKEALAKNLEHWRRVVGAAIVVHVHRDNPEKCYWANLKDDSNFTPTQFLISASQKFGKASKRQIADLCGTIHHDLLLRRIHFTTEDFLYLKDKKHLQTAARNFYKSLQKANLCIQGLTPPVRFTREGWRHLTRPSRSRLVQLQSLQLLGVIPKLHKDSSVHDLEIINPKKGEPAKFASLTTAASFPCRQTVVVKLVLRTRDDPECGQTLSFHTLYEVRRKRNLVGGKA